ncbi:MAG TPA: hypothetical protein VGK16_09980 [Candidatus Limnocylindrales bacterium]
MPGVALLTLLTVMLGASIASPVAAVTATVWTVPTSASAGSTVEVGGSGFAAYARVQLTWDGSTSGMPGGKTSSTGTLMVRLTLPSDASAGAHLVSMVQLTRPRRSGDVNPSASTWFDILPPSSSATASPTEAPTAPAPTATPIPTDAPTAAPSATPTPTPTPTPAAFLFGTTLTSTARAAGEAASGVAVAHLELGWDLYEPQDGVFSSTYAAQARQRLDALRAAGARVVLGIGLQYPPAWVFTYPDSRYRNQYGRTSGTVNLTFNATLRAKAEQYFDRVAADLGLTSFWAVRVGAGGSVETLFPAEWDGTTGNAYWAYDANAQQTTPFPGWTPGQTSWNGRPFGTTEVAAWYDWYVGSLASGVAWQIDAYRSRGFTGWAQVLMPGQGVRPADYARAIAGFLGGPGDDNRTMGRGAAWDRLVAALPDRSGVVAYVSSMADGSGGDDLCAGTDGTVAPTSPVVSSWSAARWIAYLADRRGMPKMGENPGRSDSTSYGAGMLDRAAAQMASCRFQGLLWAHDADLYDPTSGVTLDDLSSVIRRY